MGWAEDIDNIIAAEKITFIAYYIGVYESIQKFIGLITNAVRAQKNTILPLDRILPLFCCQ